MTTADEFAGRTDPYRRELLAHCYRMLGSVHDAEDAVQETLLRAWRSRGTFDERRGPLRGWLYRIATNACLDALALSARRPLPSSLGQPSDAPEGPLDPPADRNAWLQPWPDALDPAAIAVSRDSVRLAFVAALQLLPPRQRAVLILRDVLAWRAAEVAEALGTSTAAVNSILQRARARLAEADTGRVVEPAEPDARRLLDRYVSAFENADVATITALLRDDAILEMPPRPTWFRGRLDVSRFLARIFATRCGADTWRLVPTAANEQPAAAVYLDGRPHSIQVLTVSGPSIARIVAFQDPALFEAFGLAAEAPVRR
ncbi:sigma-70 family RNA polymerase sigma factor [Actinomadura latina]|uniref:Sigma-70 family RNA polymerase sigma factor n=1 Tax=Actinomadura latina TaxID=163603 RepID=A0A846Z6P5_9ACTN|nr:sigma-70 family RNA polymerase sigma factor [Actinomadura latina]NKZ06912.1 sigma-70 family RNA polymerase sigma factor [Actinomadura latina]